MREWRPFTQDGDLAERAAILLRGIIQDHPFTDGNKRAGFAACVEFLSGNGVELDAPDDAVTRLALDVAQGRLDLHGIAA